MLAKRMLELKPSRKRRREDMSPADDMDPTEIDEPFRDDLIGFEGPVDNQQTGFFDLHDHMSDYSPSLPADGDGQETAGLHPPPPGLSPPQPASDSSADVNPREGFPLDGQETTGLQAPPPGLSPHHLNMPQLPGSSRDTPQLPGSSDDMPDVPDSSMGSSPCSLLEPEQEVVPPSRNASGPPEPLPPLQQALRRSPAALDGIPSRTRSRSPHRAHLAFRENAKAGNCFHGFLARRVNKKSAAVLLLRPPPGGLPNVPEGSLLRARKPVYGTRDAPRGFFKRLNNVSISQGLQPVPHEHAAYVLRDEEGVQGMMVAHVDDLLWSGTAKMDEVMKAITEEFKFGTLEIGSTFSYCGRVISQEDEGIRVTYPNHAAKVKPVYLDYRRRRQRACAVTEPEREQLRSVVGSLNWMVRVCRMDIAYEVNYYLQAIMKSATVNDLIICNNLRQEDPRLRHLLQVWCLLGARHGDLQHHRRFSCGRLYDMSGSGEPMGNRSQSGRILALGPKNLATSGMGHIHVIEFHSNVIKRVCRSTHAEALSLRRRRAPTDDFVRDQRGKQWQQPGRLHGPPPALHAHRLQVTGTASSSTRTAYRCR